MLSRSSVNECGHLSEPRNQMSIMPQEQSTGFMKVSAMIPATCAWSFAPTTEAIFGFGQPRRPTFLFLRSALYHAKSYLDLRLCRLCVDCVPFWPWWKAVDSRLFHSSSPADCGSSSKRLPVPCLAACRCVFALQYQYHTDQIEFFDASTP